MFQYRTAQACNTLCTIVMEKTKTIIKVKDTSFIMLLIFAFCVFPIVFFLTANALNQNYLIAALITITVYTVCSVFYFRRLKREEDVYAITADNECITIRKHGTYKWSEILNIETFTKIPLGRRSHRKYIKFILSKGREIELDATSYDIDYKELMSELNKIRGDRQ